MTSPSCAYESGELMKPATVSRRPSLDDLPVPPTCDAAFRLPDQPGRIVRCDREALHGKKDQLGHAVGVAPRDAGGRTCACPSLAQHLGPPPPGKHFHLCPFHGESGSVTS